MQAESSGLSYIPYTQPDTQTAKPKRKKWPVVVAMAALFLIGTAGGVIYYFWTHPKTPVAETPSEPVASDFLTETASWEKLNSPSVIWSFKADGTGEFIF